MSSKNNKALIAIPPGETLFELLEERNMTQAELAERIDRPHKTINEIIKGKAAITPETAIQLEKVFGVPAHLWNNLESEYQTIQARIENEKELTKELKQADLFPYLEMQHYKWVPEESNKLQRVKNLLNFFGVSSLNNIIEKSVFSCAQYRISLSKGYSKPAIMTWLRRGVIESRQFDVGEFSERKLKSYLPEIRRLTKEDPKVFHGRLIEIFSDCGVVFVVTPNFKNAPINGSTRWLSPTKALIQLSVRLKYADIFWFSLFHEIGHLLLHSKKITFVDFNDRKNIDQEIGADEFASNTLIPENEYNNFLNFIENDKRLPKAIIKFARSIDVHHCIVIGRLQHDGIIPWGKYSSMKPKYELAYKDN